VPSQHAATSREDFFDKLQILIDQPSIFANGGQFKLDALRPLQTPKASQNLCLKP
jgi:hypothetical protein